MPWREQARLLAAAALLAAVLLIALAVRGGLTAQIDAALLDAANAVPVWVAAAAALVTRLGDSVTRIVIAGVVAAGLWVAQRRSDALLMAGAVIGGAMFNSALKDGFARARPALWPHLDQVHSTSFPSGHAAGAAELWLALALVAVRLGAPARWMWGGAGLMIAAIGLSRVVLAVHWPSDVLAGWCAGIAWVLVLRDVQLLGERRARR